MNQWAFRHSARNLPLKLSMNALSVGLPGREKSSVTPVNRHAMLTLFGADRRVKLTPLNL